MKVRAATGGDMAFVLDSWLKSYRTSHTAGLIAMDSWADVMRPQLLRLMSLPDVTTRVAYHPGEESGRHDIYGWICAGKAPVTTLARHQARYLARLIPAPLRPDRREGPERLAEVAREELGDAIPVVHYAFTKVAFRKHGVFKALARASGIDLSGPLLFSCRTSAASDVAQRLPSARFDPLVARFSMAANPKTKPGET